jgi:hypothetical protein
VQAQGLEADCKELGFRCYLGEDRRTLQQYERVIISIESLLKLGKPPTGGSVAETPTYDVIVLDEIVSLAAAFGGVTMGANTNATVKFLQLLCNRAQYIFCADADWDDRAEMLVCHLKGNVTVSPVLFDVQAPAPMQRQMRLYFAGAGDRARGGEVSSRLHDDGARGIVDEGLCARHPRSAARTAVLAAGAG